MKISLQSLRTGNFCMGFSPHSAATRRGIVFSKEPVTALPGAIYLNCFQRGDHTINNESTNYYVKQSQNPEGLQTGQFGR
jgi:hypothetical protein